MKPDNMTPDNNISTRKRKSREQAAREKEYVHETALLDPLHRRPEILAQSRPSPFATHNSHHSVVTSTQRRRYRMTYTYSKSEKRAKSPRTCTQKERARDRSELCVREHTHT